MRATCLYSRHPGRLKVGDPPLMTGLLAKIFSEACRFRQEIGLKSRPASWDAIWRMSFSRPRIIARFSEACLNPVLARESGDPSSAKLRVLKASCPPSGVHRVCLAEGRASCSLAPVVDLRGGSRGEPPRAVPVAKDREGETVA